MTPPTPLIAAPSIAALVVCALAWPSAARAQWAVTPKAVPPGWACGSFIQSGRLEPEDYRRPSYRLRTVETYHFGPNVESLTHPMQKGMTFGSDLDFTLWGYPNHHRALLTLTRLAAREKTDQPAGAQFTVDCYFARALLIAPDDVVARMMYARYLGTEPQRLPQALAQMKTVVQLAGDNPYTYLNAGLVYVELGALDEAAAQARRVEELGYPSTRLTDELKRLDKWPGAVAAADRSASGAANGATATSDAPAHPAAAGAASNPK